MKKLICILLSATSLSACTSIEAVRPDIAAKPIPSRYDEIALINQLGSGLIDHSQKMTVAAIAMADMKVWAQRS
jgi:hypothetical protein